MATIAKLVVELGMDDKDFKSSIENSTKSIESWGKAMLGAGAIITGAIAAPIIAGSKAAWDQVDAVEQATVAMLAYADSTEEVDAVLGQLLDYARSDMGVLFSRQELFAAAQSMLMYGASIEDVADYTEILSRSVGLGLSNWDDLNRVIGRVGSTGRLTGNDFDYLRAAGYDLDDSLRNTDITWQELMMHLDQGIPADALAGQADTIRGRTIRLQSALRGLGLAFLGVDADTSKFIEGGLGDTMVKGMSQLTELMKQAAPAVQQFGTWVGDSASKLSVLVDWFIELPQPLKTALLLFTGISGVALTLGGAFVLVSAKIMAFMKVVAGLGGLTGIVKGFGAALRALTLTNPLFWALAAAVGAFVAYKNDFMGFRSAVNRFATDARRYMRQVADVFRTVAEVVSYFGRTWSNAFSAFLGSGRDPVSAGFMAVRQALYEVSVIAGPFGGILRGIGDAFGAVRHVVDDVKESFDSFGSAASNLGDAIGFLLDGEWGNAFTSLKDAAADGLDGVLTALDSVLDAVGQFGGWVIERLGDLGSRLWNWISGQVSSVDWAGAFSAGLGALASAGAWIVEKLGDAWTGISTWFTTQLSRVPWEALGKASLSALSSFGSWVVETFGSAITAIQTWFTNQFDGVEWSTVATNAIDTLAMYIGAAVSGMASIASNLLNWLTSQVTGISWSSVGSEFGRLLAIALKAAIGVIALAGKLFLQLMIELGKVDWATLAKALWNLLKAAALAALDFIGGIIDGFYNEFKTGIGGKSWGDVWSIITDALESAMQAVVGKVVGIINTIIEAINQIPWVPDIPTIENPYAEVEAGANEAAAATQGLERLIQSITQGQPSRTPREGTPEGADSNATMPSMDFSIGKGTGAAFLEISKNALEASSSVDGLNGVLRDSAPAFNTLASTAPIAGSAIQTTGGQVRGASGGIRSSLDSMRSNAVSNFSTLASSASSNFRTMQSAASRESLSMRSNTTSNTSSMQSSVAGHTLGMRTSAALQMGLMASAAATSGAQMDTGLTGWMAGARARIVVAMSGIVSTVRNTGSAGYDAGYYAGSQISRGFANGMNAYLGQITAAANAMVARASQAVVARAMISSPSRLFQQYGEYIGEGLEIGIRRSIPGVGRAAGSLLDTAMPTLNTPIGGGGTTVVNNYYQQDVKVMTSAEWEAYKQKSERGNAAYGHLNDPDAHNYGGGI